MAGVSICSVESHLILLLTLLVVSAGGSAIRRQLGSVHEEHNRTARLDSPYITPPIRNGILDVQHLDVAWYVHDVRHDLEKLTCGVGCICIRADLVGTHATGIVSILQNFEKTVLPCCIVREWAGWSQGDWGEDILVMKESWKFLRRVANLPLLGRYV